MKSSLDPTHTELWTFSMALWPGTTNPIQLHPRKNLYAGLSCSGV